MAEIDQALAPLIELLWRRGIQTAFCCQDAGDSQSSPHRRGWAMLIFDRLRHALAFMDAVTMFEPGGRSLYNRISHQGCRGVRCWDYEVNPVDHSYDPDTDSYSSDGQADYDFRVTVYLPASDIPTLVGRLRGNEDSPDRNDGPMQAEAALPLEPLAPLSKELERERDALRARLEAFVAERPDIGPDWPHRVLSEWTEHKIRGVAQAQSTATVRDGGFEMNEIWQEGLDTLAEEIGADEEQDEIVEHLPMMAELFDKLICGTSECPDPQEIIDYLVAMHGWCRAHAEVISMMCEVIDAVRTSSRPVDLYWASDLVEKLEAAR